MQNDGNKIESFISAYQESLAEKRHYDNLSWNIGAVVLIFIGALSTYIFHIKIDNYWISVLKRGGAALFGIILSYLWLRIYERNRFYAEVANEKARELEKLIGVDGVAHGEMMATLNAKVLLKNTSFDGSQVKEPHLVPLKRDSMHKVVRTIIYSIWIILIAECFIP